MCGSANTATDMGGDGTEQVLKYIYDNLDAFRLIFCNSAGTEYEDYFDRLAETEEKFYRDFVRKYANEPQGFMKSIREYSFAGWMRVME